MIIQLIKSLVNNLLLKAFTSIIMKRNIIRPITCLSKDGLDIILVYNGDCQQRSSIYTF
ncbi:hypothetical protein BY458DRAFT_516987 [Sporodiniella umbellata]|nr:hypothetical protein BY458DRAFT_516987 [Sporodiniella umbellata]